MKLAINLTTGQLKMLRDMLYDDTQTDVWDAQALWEIHEELDRAVVASKAEKATTEPVKPAPGPLVDLKFLAAAELERQVRKFLPAVEPDRAETRKDRHWERFTKFPHTKQLRDIFDFMHKQGYRP